MSVARVRCAPEDRRSSARPAVVQLTPQMAAMWWRYSRHTATREVQSHYSNSSSYPSTSLQPILSSCQDRWAPYSPAYNIRVPSPSTHTQDWQAALPKAVLIWTWALIPAGKDYSINEAWHGRVENESFAGESTPKYERAMKFTQKWFWPFPTLHREACSGATSAMHLRTRRPLRVHTNAVSYKY